MKMSEGKIGEEYLTPKGFRIKILKKNENHSVDVELIDMLENGKPRKLTIPKVDVNQTEIKSINPKEDSKMSVEKENVAPEQVPEKGKKEKVEKVEKGEKKDSKSSLIKELLQKGGMTTSEIAAEVVKKYTDADIKKVKNQVSVKISDFVKAGYKVEKGEDKKVKVVKG